MNGENFTTMRSQAWRSVRSGWLWRYVVVWMVFAVASGLLSHLWNLAVAHYGIKTWSAFLASKAQVMSTGMTLSVPSRAVACEMTGVLCFEIFWNCILSGLFAYAFAGFFLRAAKGDSRNWFGAPFEALLRPLGLAALFFRYALRIALWSCLFVVPGIVAAYRYCQCWNIKVEHPDWSSGRCLAESARMMNGRKRDRFLFDCSYWRPIGALLLLLLVLSSLSLVAVSGGASASLGIAAMLLCAACTWGAVVLSAYMSIGQALFYLEVKDSAAVKEEGGVHEDR